VAQGQEKEFGDLAASCYSFANDKIERRLLHPKGFRAARMEKT
jgi:hypothetical protein